MLYSTSPNTRRSPSLHALFLPVTFLPEQRSLLQHTDPPPDTILSNLAAVPENSMLPAPETLHNSVPVQRTSAEALPEPLTWNAASLHSAALYLHCQRPTQKLYFVGIHLVDSQTSTALT